MKDRQFSCVVIGVSAGGLNALTVIFHGLSVGFPIPVAVVQHEKSDSEDLLAELLNNKTDLCVKTAEEKDNIEGGVIYICPANYHLLVEENKTLSLSVDPRVNHARPSIDVLFETAASAYGKELIAVILTGASSDGSIGLRQVMNHGGYAIVQDPATAYSRIMPEAAIKACRIPDEIVPLEEISARLNELCRRGYSL